MDEKSDQSYPNRLIDWLEPAPPVHADRRIYLPQLDGLRFIAFFLVLLHHNVTARQYFPADSKLGAFLGGASAFGWIGVDIFLTLSSFLIVTLLTLEQQATGTISIRNFYIRRALRIWPLYFGFVIFSMVLLPLVMEPPQPYADTLRWHLFPYITFTGNFSYAYFPSLHYGAHLWTISLEEQFYLAVPLLIIFAPRLGKALGWWALGLLAVSTAFRLYIQFNEVKYPMLWVLPPCRLDPFIAGAFCSWLYVTHRDWLEYRWIGWTLAILGVAGFVLVAQFSYIGSTSIDNVWQFTVIALSAGCLLLAAVAPTGIGNLLSWKPVVFLGKISFGLYVYHLLPLTIELRYVRTGEHLGKAPLTWLLILSGIFAVTVLLSALSYYGYERPFVRLKARFESVKSRPA
jgi:peptidoglycan/LPS O-acetylase OafA/YrhL